MPCFMSRKFDCIPQKEDGPSEHTPARSSSWGGCVWGQGDRHLQPRGFSGASKDLSSLMPTAAAQGLLDV